MSGTSHRLTFGVVTRDSPCWTPENQVKFEHDGDKVVYMLEEIMATAADAFIKANPDLFVVSSIS